MGIDDARVTIASADRHVAQVCWLETRFGRHCEANQGSGPGAAISTGCSSQPSGTPPATRDGPGDRYLHTGCGPSQFGGQLHRFVRQRPKACLYLSSREHARPPFARRNGHRHHSSVRCGAGKSTVISGQSVLLSVGDLKGQTVPIFHPTDRWIGSPAESTYGHLDCTASRHSGRS